jgi:hypothetical protein
VEVRIERRLVRHRDVYGYRAAIQPALAMGTGDQDTAADVTAIGVAAKRVTVHVYYNHGRLSGIPVYQGFLSRVSRVLGIGLRSDWRTFPMVVECLPGGNY